MTVLKMSNLRICMGNHESVTGWEKLFFLYKCLQLSAAVAIATFENPQVTSEILICSLRLCLQNFSKANCFRVYRKLITWSSREKSLYTCTCMLRNMMAHVTTFGIVLHNIIMIANVRIWIRVILRLKKIIIRKPPISSQYTRKPYLILMVSIAYHFLWPVCLPCLVTHKECRWDRGSKKSLINKRSWLKKAMKLLDWSVSYCSYFLYSQLN